jgi:hypothetical protein
MVLPHLQYCLMVWGDFKAGRNKAYGETLLKHQKRFVGLIVGKGGCYHADPLFAGYGILKVGTYIGSSSGFTHGSSGMVGSQMGRWRLSGEWMSRTVTVPGQLGAGWWWAPLTIGW